MNIKTLISNIELYPQRLISRSLFIATLSTLGLMTGIVPRVSNLSLISWSNAPVYAQESFINQGVTAEEITKYANSVLQIEKLRVGVYTEIQNEFQKQSLGGAVPPIICNEKSSVNRLPKDIKVIAVNYCNQAKKIIEGNNLTVSRFNVITQLQRKDETWRERIKAELVRIQQQNSN
ncbi:DUF4168 domain-containing protein [Okeania sp.]|uniref:DUF4168 domain-containing protein n=1 Tax=Okeania sp. TaxID=3100323 RepID=UPI002B4AC963|nr:DUF4168 domain-containing protein [Okeania sp.]MEB3341771.1 DUF4168 domain-containing protein [Okeania sp.]